MNGYLEEEEARPTFLWGCVLPSVVVLVVCAGGALLLEALVNHAR